MTGFDYIFGGMFFNGNVHERTPDEAAILNKAFISSSEWTCWIDRPPPSGQLVEIKRIGSDEIYRIIPERQSPEWNVAGVSWRPAFEVAS